jgi:hypothetical protein
MNDLRQHQRPDARRSVIRSATVWTPVFVLAAALSVWLAIVALRDSPSAWISFAITALIALLSGVSAFGALRDLYAEPMETTGPIDRKWRKSDILLFRGHYLLIQRRVFRIPREIYDAMPDAGGEVRVEHYPHTNALISWSRAAADAGADEAEPAPAAPRPRPEPTTRVEPPALGGAPPPPPGERDRPSVRPPSFGWPGRDSDETPRR